MANLKQLTATGNVTTLKSRLHSVSLTAAAAAATLELRDGTGTAVRLSLSAPIATTVTWTAGSDGVYSATAIHATLGGAGAVASFEYS